MLVELVCPECRNKLTSSDTAGLNCIFCQKTFPRIDNLISFLPEDHRRDTGFYQAWQRKIDKIQSTDFKAVKLTDNAIFSALKKYFRKDNELSRILLLLIDYFNARKELFFKSFLNKEHCGIILDIGCGKGMKFLNRYGYVVGVDFNIDVLVDKKDNCEYPLRIHCGASKLPFKNGQFDYIVSSDFLEHIPYHQKDAFYKELSRVLKKEGKMAHFVTTDSKNIWFTFAHRYPEFFRRYLVDEIGGHYGLEFPEDLIRHVKQAGFEIISVKKMLWEPVEFVLRFDNEYKEKNILLNWWIRFYRKIMKYMIAEILINIPISIIFRLTEFFMPINHSNKIAVVFRKSNCIGTADGI